jgi:ABC-type nickel/cobalt efflux system permease component RcnA
MSTDAIALGTAAMLGFLHALEVDHMVAVTTFVSRRPTRVAALRFGFRWGLGHAVAVLAVGGLLLATGLRWPTRYDTAGEALVGLMLIGLGVWALDSARKLHLHSHEEHGGHAHLHLHKGQPAHAHSHGPAARAEEPHEHGGITLVGLLHGLAGTTGVVALVPVTMMDRVGLGLGYLACFGVGVTLAMMVFALVAAGVMRRTAAGSLVWGRRVVRLVGISGVAIGAWWLLAAAGI